MKQQDQPPMLEEGELYVYRKGLLQHVERDEEDTLHRIRITDDAFNQVSKLQRALRTAMQGYRPGIEIIASAVLQHYTQASDALEVVRRYGEQLYARRDPQNES